MTHQVVSYPASHSSWKPTPNLRPKLLYLDKHHVLLHLGLYICCSLKSPHTYLSSSWGLSSEVISFWKPCCCCSVAKLCPAVCDPMDCRTPGFPVLHYLRVCSYSCPLSQWCHPTISSCHPLLLLPSVFPSIRIFSSESDLLISWPNIGASVSVLSVNIQGWFPLGLTGLISLLSKGLSQESSPAPHFKSINSSGLSLLCGPTLTSIYDCWKNHSFDYMDLCLQNNVSAF